MSIEAIPDDDSLLRYVKPKLVIRDPETNEVLGVWPNAFELREGEDGLSAAWIEFYKGDLASRLTQAVGVFRSVMDVRKSAMFVAGDVAAIKTACAQYNVAVRIVSEPEEGHAAHALVRRFRNDIPELQAELAEVAWCRLVPPG